MKDDYPFDEVAKEVDAMIKKGATCYQKFTCCKCGNRLVIEIPNTFYLWGTCDACGTLTDIRKYGCNYMAVFAADSRPDGYDG